MTSDFQLGQPETCPCRVLGEKTQEEGQAGRVRGQDGVTRGHVDEVNVRHGLESSD